MIDPKASARKTIIENVRIDHCRPGEALFPQWMFKDEEEPKEVWMVWTATRTGLTPSRTSFRVCYSEEEANALAEKHPAGTELPDVQGFGSVKQDWLRRRMDTSCSFGVAAGDSEAPLAFDVLGDSGVYRKRYAGLSPKVLTFLGKQRTGVLKNRFGENWAVAAAFEYCWLNLPHASPAFVAASYQYHYDITGDKFSAGYHWRDLEVLAHGVEAEAVKSIEMRKKAGAAGSLKSAKAREARINALLTAMEDVALRNPDVVKLGEEALARLALSLSCDAEPDLWRQGKGQAIEYVGEIRRGEAGEEMQARYRSLLGDKPPKRFTKIRSAR